MSNKLSPNSKAREVLLRWMRHNKKSTPEVADELNYAYQHFYLVIKGVRPVSFELLGKLFAAYMADGPAPAMAEHMRHLLEPITPPAAVNGKGK
jgi:hypothetical protein